MLTSRTMLRLYVHVGRTVSLRSDHELMEASLDGDLAAFDELMQRYERLVYRVAIHLLHHSESAFDVTQTVFLKAFEGLARFRHESNVKTWLLRITYNECIDCLRRHRSQGENHDPLEEASAHLAAEAVQEREALRREDRLRLARALADLNERYRLAVVLRYFQGLSIAEIASVLGCSEGVTKNMLFRSVRSLRESLAETV